MSSFRHLLIFAVFLAPVLYMVPAGNGLEIPARNDPSIIPDPEWGGISTIEEDSDPVSVPLDGPSGPFLNTSENITGYLIAPPGSLDGSTWMNTSIAGLSIIGSPSSHSLFIDPHEDMNGLIGFELIAVGENSTSNRTAAVRISSVNDPPVVYSIKIENRTHEVDGIGNRTYEVMLDGKETIYDNSYLNFTIGASPGDRPEEGDSLVIKYEVLGSDDWDNRPGIDPHSGNISLWITTADWSMRNDRLVLNIRDEEFSEVILIIHFTISHENLPPEIMIANGTRTRWEQYEEIAIHLIGSDPESTVLSFDVNFEDPVDGIVPSIRDQLPYIEFEEGIDYGFKPTLPFFWMKLDDPLIWKAGNHYLDEIQLVLVFKATDVDGANSTVNLTVHLIDINEEPFWEVQFLNVTPPTPERGRSVTFHADRVVDPDGDLIEYRWDMGDGTVRAGQTVSHTYHMKGYKTVQCWATDGNLSTEKISIRIEVLEQSFDPWYEMDNDGDGILNGQDDFVNDRSASKDSDGDGHPDQWNAGYTKLDSTTGLSIDMFPHDGTEWIDTDGDGRGDNGDEFPHDKDEWKDSDGDGIGDNADKFPNVPNDSIKWYILGVAIALLIVIALLLVILRNAVNRSEGSYVDDEE